MKISHIVLVLLLAVAAGFGGAKLAGRGDGAAQGQHVETGFERVMRTNTIRCGYYVYPPVTYRDPNTGKLSGFSVDMMEKIAEKAGLKVEWTDEVNFGNWTQELEADRLDVACTPMWPAISLGRKVLFSRPMFYSQIYAIGRQGETRFNSLADLNKPDVKITVADANETLYLVRDLLPNATITTQPQNAGGTQVILDVISGKADVFISDLNAMEQWNKHNDQKLAVTAGHEVLKAMPFALAVKAADGDLGNFLNNAIDDLNNTGAIARMLDKWMEFKGLFRPVAVPYQAEEK